MKRVHVLSGVACVSLLLATGAMAEILGVHQGPRLILKTICRSRFSKMKQPLARAAVVQAHGVTN